MDNAVFSYDKYIEIVKNDKFNVKAQKYKKQYIPEKLYKYLSLNRTKARSKKMIENEKIWASQIKVLNDPFEFNMFYANLDEANRKYFYKDVLDRNEVVSLSDSCFNKLMWAHYGDSHRGICLEYKVLNSHFIYPVNYVKYRTNITTEVNQLIKRTSYWVNNGFAIDKAEDKALIEKINLLMISKGSEWKYENEYRVVTRNHEDIKNNHFDSYKEENGSLHKTFDLGIEISKIILGYKYPENDKKFIKQIVKKINENRIHEEMKTYGLKKNKAIEILKEEERIVTINEIDADDSLNLKIKEKG